MIEKDGGEAYEADNLGMGELHHLHVHVHVHGDGVGCWVFLLLFVVCFVCCCLLFVGRDVDDVCQLPT